ncbi:MAG TPA: hypothetical protein PLG73_14060 [Candidatus Sumerlaeota bacterium]|mgnify:CR=1 FL=1|nr:hypothetical protein [Candidatus Sumerlaeota bacterium]
MGFFDSKSRQLRRKLKDLQAELKDAEKDGAYLLEGGVFFAEMDTMGEATMMVFSTAQQHGADEEEIIETFFDRNGFTVEQLALNKQRDRIEQIEIIPPNELLMAVAKALQSEGFRVVDDSAQERPVDLEHKLFPITALARATSLLFAQRVHQIIRSTRVKMTKEGNRLLSWMPLVVEALRNRVDLLGADALKPLFDQTFELFFVQPFEKPSGKRSHTPPPPPARPASTPAPARAAASTDSQPLRAPRPAPARPVASPAAAVMAPPAPTPTPAAGPTPQQIIARLTQSEQLAKVMAAMYRSLVKASPQRCVRNAESLLHHVNRLFNASATCLLLRLPGRDQMSIYAQAGRKLEWGEGAGGEGFAISHGTVQDCLQKKTVVASAPLGGGDPSESMVMYQIDATAAAPITLDDEIQGILYVDRRERALDFSREELDTLRKVSQVFQEFPDLTMGLS